jgi:Outer membrane protein beta-barrel domain
MPDLDNHMDELFQKAAENYPLKTNAGNFDDLVPFIAAETTTAAKPELLKGKRKTALLLLAFLVSGILIGTYLVSSNNKTAGSKPPSQNNGAISAQSKTATQLHLNNEEGFAAGKAIENKVNENTAAENAVTVNETFYQKNKPIYNSKAKMFTNITQADAVTDDDKIAENKTDETGKAAINKTTSETESRQKTGIEKINTEAKKEIAEKAAKKEKQANEETKPPGKKNKNKPAFYYGIAAGAELNKVKSQDMTKTGFNGGIVLGLQINKKISVETGLQLSQKKYYSDGKYFNPKAGSMPANMTVNSLESKSTLIEIPVSVKYNFSKKKNTFYGKAGLSSCIMTKESNRYQAVVSGQQQEVNTTYKTKQGYFASDVRISAGYQHTVSKKINMRIEPYVQVPIKGIGIGSLPVTTAGVQIVFIRN